jgi:beta-galactosidase
MPSLRFDRGCFVLGEKPAFLFGGEIHYFRLPRETWEARVAAAKQLGMNTIASYIPWIWHEPDEGRFDLCGETHPQRDLRGFIDVVEAAGLFLVARMGPVSNAELTGEGLPEWLFARYPELQLRRADGSFQLGVPSYRHPGFLRHVARWYQHVVPEIAPRTVSRGGPVVLVQLDNEIDMPTWLSRQPDYHEHVNAQWAQATRASDARQPMGAVVEWPSREHTRWMDFWASYFAGYVRDLRQLAMDIDVPAMVNIAQWTDHELRGRGIHAPMTTMAFRDVAGGAPGTIIGGDYYPRRMDYDNFHDVVIATEVVRMISVESPVVCPELQAGGNEDRPRVYASDLELLLHTAAGHGLNMLSAYMLAGGANPPGLGCFGVEHDWQAPIAADGTLRPSAGALARFGAFLETAPHYGATRKRSDTQFGFYAPYFQTEYLRGAPVEDLERRRVDAVQDGILRILTVANIAYGFVDLVRQPALRDVKTLWVFAEDWMDAETQRRLADYVLGGGRLFVFPTLPTRGAGGEPCTVLADALGGPGRRESTRFVHVVGPEATTLPTAEATVFDALPGDTVLAHDDRGRACAVVRERAAWGDGRAILVGFSMRHRFDRQIGIVRGWAERLGVRLNVRIEPHDVAAVCREGERELYVTMANFHEVALDVRGDVEWRGRRIPVEPFTLAARSAKTFLLSRSDAGTGAP